MNTRRKIEYDITYLNMAEELSKLSYDHETKVGCLILSKNGQIISHGYNGTPTGFDNECKDIICTADKCNCTDKCYANCHDCADVIIKTKSEVLHAESNAIAKCAKYVSSTDGATVYVTLSPCKDCAKLIIQAGISRVVYRKQYKDLSGVNLLKQAGIKVDWENELLNIEED